ncbi:MAG: hypothetical protein HXL86_04830 [[Eubacterium] sulci]|nr:hypothetical protein [[Eubacterium] sulci]
METLYITTQMLRDSRTGEVIEPLSIVAFTDKEREEQALSKGYISEVKIHTIGQAQKAGK